MSSRKENCELFIWLNSVWIFTSLQNGYTNIFNTLERIISRLPRWLRICGKESAFNGGDTGDAGLIPGSKRALGGWQGNPLEYSCQENPTDRRVLRTVVHRVSKIRT